MYGSVVVVQLRPSVDVKAYKESGVPDASATSMNKPLPNVTPLVAIVCKVAVSVAQVIPSVDLRYVPPPAKIKKMPLPKTILRESNEAENVRAVQLVPFAEV